MTLADLSIKKPVFAWMLMLGLILFGWISFKNLGISQLPDVDFPVLNITVQWPGAAPEIIETELAEPVEQALVSVEGIKDLSSSIRQGTLSISLEFDVNRNIDAALQEVQSSISRVRLPLDVEPAIIRKQNPEDQPIMWLGISSEKYSLRELITYVELNIKDQFQILPGVGEVLLGGYTERNLRVRADTEKLKEHELTILDLSTALQRGHIEGAAGTLINSQQEINLRFMGEGFTVKEIEDIVIASRGGSPIFNSSLKIKDVATVVDDLADVRRVSRMNGRPGLGIGIRKQRGANAVEVGNKVKTKLVELQKVLPPELKIEMNFDSTVFIKEAVEETEFTLLLSALITALVCYLFLGSLRPTFNILLSIPTSIIGTFTVMYFFNFTLNLFTILALALAIGIVVDDAIMVLENIYRHFRMGKSRTAAAREGANEITFAAIAATIAVIAIFLPVVFMTGAIGEFFFQFGVTLSAAVAISLLEAITLTPMRCAQFMEAQQGSNKFTSFLDRVFATLASLYKQTLTQALQARYLVVLFAATVFISALFIFPLLRKEFIPAQDQSTFLVRVETAVGSSLEHTANAVKIIEDFLLKRNDIKRVFVAVGGFGGGEVNTAMAFVTLVEPKQRLLSQDQIMQVVRKHFQAHPTIKVSIQDLSTRGLTARRGFPVDLNLRGADWQVLSESSNKIIDRLKATNMVVDIDNDYRLGQPEIRLVPIRAEASKLGVSMQSINDTITAAMSGIRIGKYTNDSRRYDLRVSLADEERTTKEYIHGLTVRNIHGELIPLSRVVQLVETKTLQTITRKNRERSISIYANVAPGASQAEVLERSSKIASEILPAGYRVFLGGGAQSFMESFQSLYFVLWLGLAVAYMVLASQFNSFIQPFSILLTMPFSLVGALVALYLFDQSINLYSMIGVILLMGIVKKNAILLVEFTNHKRYEEGFPTREALLEACPIRLRPVLMTSLATIAAAVPPALAIGPGAESRIPMALTIVGGMLVSTVFTLYVVPCAYYLMSALETQKK